MRSKLLAIASFILCLVLGVSRPIFGQEQPDFDGNVEKAKHKEVKSLNSNEIDYAPAISADGKTIIFESNREDYVYKLYQAHLDKDGEWTSIVGLDSINQYGDELDLIGGPSLSFDENTLYFFASYAEGLGMEDIYYAEREGAGWSKPINIGAPINTDGYEGFPSISPDGQQLYFMRLKDTGKSKRKQKRNECYQIYRATKNLDGSWCEPELLPAPINLSCEKAPQIMADGRTLIFSSNRRGDGDDYDLFQSHITTIGDWSQPVALDYVNSGRSDQFCAIPASGDLMYFVYDNEDIHSLTIPKQYRQFENTVLQGVITDGEVETPLPATIVVSDAFTSQKMRTIENNNGTGDYNVVLAVGGSYNVEIKRPGYTTTAFSYDLTKDTDYQVYEHDAVLYPTATLSLHVYDVELLAPVDATVEVKVSGQPQTFQSVTTIDKTGHVNLDLPIGQPYEVSISVPHYDPHEFNFDLSGYVVYNKYERDVEITPHKKNVKVDVTNLINNAKVSAKVRIRNQNKDELIEVNGNQEVALRVGDRYEIVATSDQGYAFNSTVLEVTEEETEQNVAVSEPALEIELALQPLYTGANLTLKDILFESNSAHLSEISFQELDRVVDLMFQYNQLAVEISAHTDDKGSKRYNLILSKKRAQQVADYLVANLIDPSRLVVRGYGEAQPVVPNSNEENRAKNRRVTLKILKGYN